MLDTGERLRFAMERKGISLKELSEQAHISVPTLRRYLNGIHSPSYFPAGKMAIVLEVASDWLRGLDVPMEGFSYPNAYTEEYIILHRIIEDPDLKEILSILLEMPADKLKTVKEMMHNL